MDNNLLMMLINYLTALIVLLIILVSKRKKYYGGNMTAKHQENEFLKSIFDEINTCIDNDSDEYKNSKIKSTYLRLRDENVKKDKAIDLIASVVVSEALFFFKSKKNELLGERFYKNLDNLPKKPQY